MSFSNLQNKFSKSLSWAWNLNKLFTVKLWAVISNFKFRIVVWNISSFFEIWQTHCTYWNEATFRISITVLQLLSLTLVVHSMLDKDTVGCFGQLYRTKRIKDIMKVVNLILCIPATISLSCFLLYVFENGVGFWTSQFVSEEIKFLLYLHLSDLHSFFFESYFWNLFTRTGLKSKPNYFRELIFGSK